MTRKPVQKTSENSGSFHSIMKRQGWKESEFYVYVIENTEGHLYVGMTEHLVRRLRQHRKGHTRSTNKGNLDWELMWFWNFDTYKEASKWERVLHKFQKEGVISEIMQHPEVDDYIKGRISLMKDTRLELCEGNRQRQWIMQGRGNPEDFDIRG